MKIKNILSCGFIVVSLSITSCSKDNYKAPDAGIKGEVIDVTTNEPIQTEQPNGVKIRLLEVSYGDDVTPIDFWCKSDGTFENSNLFADKYEVVPIEGAFFPADTAAVDVSGTTTVDFKVTPFLTVKATATPATGSVITNYTISRTQAGGKITACKTLVSFTPSVSNTINEFSVVHDLSAVPDDSVLNHPYTDTVRGLTSGETYYVRVGAIAANANNKYNYSKIFTVTVP